MVLCFIIYVWNILVSSEYWSSNDKIEEFLINHIIKLLNYFSACVCVMSPNETEELPNFESI